MSKYIQRYGLLAILILASVLRLWQIGTVPPSPSLDEVSIGYNAYSILHTGMDEYGTHMPLLLRAYDDWRPSLYVYLVIPFIWLFGLSVSAVRAPSAILGIISVWATYELVRGLVPGKSKPHWLALIASGLLAVSPWQVYLSRLGHEANAGFAFFLLAGMFFFKKRWVLCSLFFALSFVSYQSEKVVVPVMMLTLGLIFIKDLWKERIKLVFPGIVFIAIVTPFLIATLQPEALVRFKATNVLISYEPYLIDELNKYIAAKESGDVVGRIIHNRILVSAKLIGGEYLKHFNVWWLFSNNDAAPHSHKAPHMGLMYLFEAVFVVIGIGVLIFTKKGFGIEISWKNKCVMFVWLLSGPLPAAITTQAPHAMRSYTSLPIWQILGAIGIVAGYRLIQNLMRSTKVWPIYTGIIGIGGVMGLVAFWHNYFVVFPETQSDSFQYALRKSIEYVGTVEHTYDHIVFSNERNLYQSYMFYLFVSRYDPATYNAHGGTSSGGYAEHHVIGSIEFRPIQWDNEKSLNGKTLYIGNYDDFPAQAPLVSFTHLSGLQAIWVVQK